MTAGRGWKSGWGFLLQEWTRHWLSLNPSKARTKVFPKGLNHFQKTHQLRAIDVTRASYVLARFLRALWQDRAILVTCLRQLYVTLTISDLKRGNPFLPAEGTTSLCVDSGAALGLLHWERFQGEFCLAESRQANGSFSVSLTPGAGPFGVVQRKPCKFEARRKQSSFWFWDTTDSTFWFAPLTLRSPLVFRSELFDQTNCKEGSKSPSCIVGEW